MNKKDKELIIELIRDLEYVVHNCAEHLKREHSIPYEKYPYFENIEIRLRERRQTLEKGDV